MNRGTGDRERRGPILAVLLIGLGLVAAPAIFQMFDRAPLGAEMIDEFGVYMTQEQVDLFQGYMADIRAAEAESRDVIRPGIAVSGVMTDDEYGSTYPLVVKFNDEWAGIDADMTDLLDTMDANLGNFEAVVALPSFDLFPWFFVIPGFLVALTAGIALRRARSRLPTRELATLIALGVAIAAAPVAFQMFSRAPAGGEMIDDFRPMMVRERVQGVQSYFITMGGAEGELRNALVPFAVGEGGLGDEDVAAARAMTDQWTDIVGDFTPMISAMSDNVDNYEAVDSLPPFPLFPWFFVAPGLLVAGLAVWARGSIGRPIPHTDIEPTTT